MTIFRDGWNVLVKIAHTPLHMPVFLSGLQTGERKKQGDLRDFLCLSFNPSAGCEWSHMAYPSTQTPAFPPDLVESRRPFPRYCIQPQLWFWFSHPISWSWRSTLWHWCVLHLVQRDPGLCQVGLSPGEGGRTGGKFRRYGNYSVIWGLHFLPCCPTGTDLSQLLSFPVHLARLAA